MIEKVIITCPVTGSIATRDMNPNLPITPMEIAESAIAAYQEGAAICHIHVRDPNTGRPSICLLYTSPSPRDLSTSRMPSSA